MSSTKRSKTFTNTFLFVISIFTNIPTSSITAKTIPDEQAKQPEDIKEQRTSNNSVPVRCALTAAYYRPEEKIPKKSTPTKKVLKKKEEKVPVRCALTAVYYTPPVKPPKKITFYKKRLPKPSMVTEEIEDPLFTVLFSGYIKPEFFWDSRQVIGGRDDQTLIFPEPKVWDRCCRDINAAPAYNMIAIESRVRSEILGPKVLEAKGISCPSKRICVLSPKYTSPSIRIVFE